MIADSKEYWLRVEDTHIIELKSIKNKVYTTAVIAFLHKIYKWEKNTTKYEIKKSCPFSLKMFMYVKRVEIALLIIFFQEAKT